MPKYKHPRPPPEPGVNLVLYKSDWTIFKKFAKFRGKTMKKTMHEVAASILRSFPEFAEMDDPTPRMNNCHR